MKEEKNLATSKYNRRDFLKISGLSGGALALGGLSPIPFSYAKEVYPAKRITWLVGNAPGGGADTSSRAVAPFFEQYMKAIAPSPGKVGVIIQNLVGADGVRCIIKLHESKPDGYTIMCTTDKILGWTIGGQINFSVFDLTVIGQLAGAGKVLAANKKTNLHTWDDIVKQSKKAPIDIVIAGYAGTAHYLSIYLLEVAKLAANIVIAPNQAESMALLLRGDCPVGIYPADTVQYLVEAKEIRPIVLFTDDIGGYPGVPLAKDIGYPELMEVTNSNRFVVAPPKVPADIKKTLQDTMAKAMADKKFLAMCEKSHLGMKPLFGPKFDQILKSSEVYLRSKDKVLKKYLDVYRAV